MKKCFEGTKSKFRRQLERRDVIIPICTMWLRLSLQSSEQRRHVWELSKLREKTYKGNGTQIHVCKKKKYIKVITR